MENRQTKKSCEQIDVLMFIVLCLAGVVMMLIHAMGSDMEMVVTHMQAQHFGHIWLGVGDQVFHQENTFPVVDPVLVVTPLFINRLVLSYWLGLDC